MAIMRDYINARYEADLHSCGLMNLTDPRHKNQPQFSNEKEAVECAEDLQGIVDAVTNSYFGYDSETELFMGDIESIIAPYMEESPTEHASPHYDRDEIAPAFNQPSYPQ